MNVGYDIYISSVVENLKYPLEKMNFKSDPNYTYMLEHVSYEQGLEYLNLIKSKFTGFYINRKDDLASLVRENDQYGMPIKYQFAGIGACSPTNLRYIYHSLLILSFAKGNMQNILKIVEIGGGYGGLCFYLHKLCSAFDISIKSYNIIDLPEATYLSTKYVSALGITINQSVLSDNSFLISNYAFSEFTPLIREKYSEEVINPFISYGFLAWNFIDVYKFCNNNITHTDEAPMTGPKNKYVYITPPCP